MRLANFELAEGQYWEFVGEASLIGARFSISLLPPYATRARVGVTISAIRDFRNARQEQPFVAPCMVPQARDGAIHFFALVHFLAASEAWKSQGGRFHAYYCFMTTGYQWTNHPEAPVAGTLLCTLGELTTNIHYFVMTSEGASEFRTEALFGNKKFAYLVTRDGDNIHAYLNRCPHRRQAIGCAAKPAKFRDGDVVCRLHNAQFSLSTGECTRGISRGQGLPRIPITIVDGEVRIAIDSASQ